MTIRFKGAAAKTLGLTATVVFVLTAFSGNCRAQSEVTIRLTNHSIVIVSVMANRSGPFDFVLDTGTDTTIVDQETAHDIGLPALDSTRLNTLSGGETLTISSVGMLTLGPRKAENMEVLIADLSQMRTIDPHIRGILGQDFLGRFNYLLDYSHRVIRIEQDNEVDARVGGERIAIATNENKLLVTSEICSGGTATLHLLLDSGASSLVLIPKAVQDLNIGSQGTAFETTSDGAVAVQGGRLTALKVGSQLLQDLPVAIMAASVDDSERREDGLLPTALFAAVYVNNVQGYVIFNPKMK